MTEGGVRASSSEVCLVQQLRCLTGRAATSFTTMSAIADSGKWYHTRASGPALNTVDQHAKDEATTLFASCFCPFVQRVWIAFEYLQIPYKVSQLALHLKSAL